jgi:Tfp pilus assembly protein PilF
VWPHAPKKSEAAKQVKTDAKYAGELLFVMTVLIVRSNASEVVKNMQHNFVFRASALSAARWMGMVCVGSFLSSNMSGCATATSNNSVRKDISRPVAVDQYVDGYQAYQRGDTQTAVRELEKAVEKNPNLLMARITLGEIYRKQNDYNAAVRQYEVLAEKDAYTISNHYYLGVSYQFLTRYSESLAAYLRGLSVDAKDFGSNMNLGTVYLAVGNTENAVKYLDKATQINPRSAVAWSNLGVALDARSSYVLAETAYRKALELDTSSLPTLQNLAANLMLQKKVGEGIYLWEQIVARNKTSFTQTRLAEAYTQGAEFSRATEQVDEVLQRDPRYVPAVNAKAFVLARQYDLGGMINDAQRSEAVKLWRLSLQLNTGQPKVRDLLKKYDAEIILK